MRYFRILTPIILVTAFGVGLYSYIEIIKTPPVCALENHHGAGNCPVQLLRWYPKNAIEDWQANALHSDYDEGQSVAIK